MRYVTNGFIRSGLALMLALALGGGVTAAAANQHEEEKEEEEEQSEQQNGQEEGDGGYGDFDPTESFGSALDNMSDEEEEEE